MSKETSFYRCAACGNIVMLVEKGGGELVCCGNPMELLVANTQDASLEKHVPVVNICSNSVEVKVGSVPHPMVKEHYIQWICLETENRTQIAYLSPEDKPEANFCICGEKIKAVYEYCNLHGLWKAELPEEIADQEINCHPDFSHGCVE